MMTGFDIPWDKQKDFVDALICSPSSLNELCIEWFGVTEEQLSYESLGYITQKIFQCDCCEIYYSQDHFVNHNDENYCQWCVGEEQIEKDFSEGKITIEEYIKRMSEVSNRH